MSEAKSWAEKIMTYVNYLQNCYDRTVTERDEWIDKYHKVCQEFELYKMKVEGRQYVEKKEGMEDKNE